jgi:PPOX class probable F420-dependent enzyme
MTAELRESDVELLKGTNYATFVTIDEDGLPQSTIIWIDAADGNVLVNTAKGRVKDRNVRRDPKVSVLVVKEGDAYDWISVSGTVVGIEEGERAVAHINELSQRYDGHDYKLAEGMVREILTIRPERIIRYKD